MPPHEALPIVDALTRLSSQMQSVASSMVTLNANLAHLKLVGLGIAALLLMHLFKRPSA